MQDNDDTVSKQELTTSYKGFHLLIDLEGRSPAECNGDARVWPETSYASVEVFLCNSLTSPRECLARILTDIRPQRTVVRVVPHVLHVVASGGRRSSKYGLVSSIALSCSDDAPATKHLVATVLDRLEAGTSPVELLISPMRVESICKAIALANAHCRRPILTRQQATTPDAFTALGNRRAFLDKGMDALRSDRTVYGKRSDDTLAQLLAPEQSLPWHLTVLTHEWDRCREDAEPVRATTVLNQEQSWDTWPDGLDVLAEAYR